MHLQSARSLRLEEVEDVARIQALPDRVIRGGARVLELQAACGFRAFAEQRLWVDGDSSRLSRAWMRERAARWCMTC